VALEMAIYRWMADYRGAYPNRLGGVILAAPATSMERSPKPSLGPREPAWGLRETPDAEDSPRPLQPQ
jgi:hypothetical protein